METMVEERSQIIENYVRETERYLTAYSRAGEVIELRYLCIIATLKECCMQLNEKTYNLSRK